MVETSPDIGAEGSHSADRFMFNRAVQLIGSPRDPKIIAENFDRHAGVSLIDWVLLDRTEIVSRGEEHFSVPMFSFYMADDRTWVETRDGGIQEMPANAIVFLDLNRPIHTISLEGTRHFSLLLPHNLVKRYMSAPDRLSGRRIFADDDLLNVATGILLALRSGTGIRNASAVRSSLINGLLIALSECASDDDRRARHQHRLGRKLEQVDDIIRRRFSDPGLTPRDIAEELGISLRYLHVLCESSWPPAEMIRRHRLKMATEMLTVSTSRSITDIAFDCGFSSSSYFSTSFKNFSGVSPRAYRLGQR